MLQLRRRTFKKATSEKKTKNDSLSTKIHKLDKCFTRGLNLLLLSRQQVQRWRWMVRKREEDNLPWFYLFVCLFLHRIGKARSRLAPAGKEDDGRGRCQKDRSADRPEAGEG